VLQLKPDATVVMCWTIVSTPLCILYMACDLRVTYSFCVAILLLYDVNVVKP